MPLGSVIAAAGVAAVKPPAPKSKKPAWEAGLWDILCEVKMDYLAGLPNNIQRGFHIDIKFHCDYSIRHGSWQVAVCFRARCETHGGYVLIPSIFETWALITESASVIEAWNALESGFLDGLNKTTVCVLTMYPIAFSASTT